MGTRRLDIPHTLHEQRSKASGQECPLHIINGQNPHPPAGLTFC